jgi:hypothetical protein
MEIIRGKIPKAQKILLYGTEGIGKTTFASNMPDPLFIDTECGTAHLDAARLPAPSSWTMLMTEVAEVKANPGCCKTLVIDTADAAESLCIAQICAKKQWDSIEAPGYGKGFTYIAEEFGRLLNALSDVAGIGIHVLLTAHAVQRKVEQPDQSGAYDHWEPSLSRKTAQMTRNWCDMLLFANWETTVVKEGDKAKGRGGTKRVMHTQHTASWDAKNRHGLADRLPLEFASIAGAIALPASAAAGAAEPPAPVPAPARAAPAPAGTGAAPPPAQGTPLYEGRPLAAAPVVPEHLMALRQLMERDGVSEGELKSAVASRKAYTLDTPIERYDPQYVSGVLVDAWDQVLAIVRGQRPYNEEMPF